MKIKKLTTAAISLSLLTTMAGLPAYAASMGTSGTTVQVEGTVSPTVISVTVPTMLSFAIDNGKFTSVSAEITNESAAPCEVQLLGFKSMSGTAAKVVSATAHSDKEWDNLSRRETEKQIALGIRKNDGVIWASAESSGMSTPAGAVHLDSNASGDISIEAKHGSAWGAEGTLHYDMYLKVAMSQ